ncbi:hypothetical protein [Paracidovorax wautersii]|uniref:Type IV secretion system protein VirB5 n=1 Tax=Paracidovorax wautersii TaxID=1177982 RepID=A0ABU1IBH4_9BURK|nr:hypothetical protein [Paracidovorax wautersii]MDR6214585.1 type IV secretion system protein VirB5 [Paracidovorax wautersii]
MKQVKIQRVQVAAARIVLAVAAISASTHSGAQVIVNDTIGVGKQIAEYAEQAKRWGETLAQYQRQIAAYQQMVSTISGLSMQSLLPQQPLQRLDEERLAEQACPGAGNMVSDVLSAVTGIDLKGPVLQNSQRLCVMTTKLKVRMYNESVERANRLTVYDGQLKKFVNLINSLTGSANSNGNTQRMILDTTQTDAQLKVEMENYAANMASYQTLLKTLEDQQSILARASLRGKPSLLGGVTQAAAFAAAFR